VESRKVEGCVSECLKVFFFNSCISEIWMEGRKGGRKKEGYQKPLGKVILIV
jgi:hypothetical protein